MGIGDLLAKLFGSSSFVLGESAEDQKNRAKSSGLVHPIDTYLNQSKTSQKPAIQRAVAQPQATPTPAPQTGKQYRHPRWEENKNKFQKYFQELLSGTEIASKKYGVPQDLLMDIAMIESGGRPIGQHGGPAEGYFQFEPGQRGIPQGFDPYSATQSADLAAQWIANNQLSRWGTPGSSWGSLDATRRNPQDRLTAYYSPEELNKYLSPNYRFK